MLNVNDVNDIPLINTRKEKRHNPNYIYNFSNIVDIVDVVGCYF